MILIDRPVSLHYLMIGSDRVIPSTYPGWIASTEVNAETMPIRALGAAIHRIVEGKRGVNETTSPAASRRMAAVA